MLEYSKAASPLSVSLIDPTVPFFARNDTRSKPEPQQSERLLPVNEVSVGAVDRGQRSANSVGSGKEFDRVVAVRRAP